MGQEAWGWLIAVYLYLGGMGAGAFLVAAFFELSGWRYRRDFCPAALVGATVSGPLVAIGSVLLIFDLGAGKTEPWRIFYMFTQFESVMTWGIWILSIFIPLCLLYGLLELVEVEPFLKGLVSSRAPWLQPRVRPTRRWVAIIGSFFAVGTAVYTGVLLSDVGTAIPLWGQPILPFLRVPMLPILFLVSAVSTGLGLTFDLVATLALPHIHDEIRPMPLIHIILIGLENILIGLLFISALSAGGAAAEAARAVMYGPLSIVFWVGVVLIGLAYPFVVHAYAIGRGHHSMASGIGSGVGLIVAGLLLRYLIVAAGIPAVL